jgi:hypothetical protein
MLFDDAHVNSMGEWLDVIKYCLTARCYPTVLFFEKVDPDDMLVDSGGFKFSEE